MDRPGDYVRENRDNPGRKRVRSAIESDLKVRDVKVALGLKYK